MNAFEQRKLDHLQLALNQDHQAVGLGGLEQVRLLHDALPELDFEEVDLSPLSSSLFKKSLKTPFFIAGMTAGHAKAPSLNRMFAQAAAQRGWIMGVGSQRRELEDDSFNEWLDFKNDFPQLVLLANLGMSQLIRTQRSQVEKIVKRLGAEALVVHMNPLQEALQVEGTPHFKNAIQTLKSYQDFCVPLILKETGCGLNEKTLQVLNKLPLAAVDVSGLGGTHWGRIEGARANPDSVKARAAQSFWNWGVPLVEATLNASKILKPPMEIWASGGVRSGLDAAKCIALGAHRVGYAKIVLEAALQGIDALMQWMETQEFELKVALFCTGSQNLSQLKGQWKSTYDFF